MGLNDMMRNKALKSRQRHFFGLALAGHFQDIADACNRHFWGHTGPSMPMADKPSSTDNPGLCKGLVSPWTAPIPPSSLQRLVEVKSYKTRSNTADRCGPSKRARPRARL